MRGSKKIRLVVVDDHPMVLQGVATPVLPYGAQTIVTVSATYLGVTGSGKVVIP